MTKYSELETKDSTAYLKKLLKPGDTIYVVQKHRSSSGMSRVLLPFVVKGGKTVDITWHAARVLGWAIDDNRWGIKVGGCGMDMHFHLVYSLGRRLFPEGFVKSKNNLNRNGDRSKHDKDGGYAFNYKSL